MNNMLQHAMPSTAPARMVGRALNPLASLFRVVRQSLVEFSAQDIFQICAVTQSHDTINMTQDMEFMRGLANAFDRADQTVLTPFQVNVVTGTFIKVGIFQKAKEIAIPEEDMISPEYLLNMLKTMHQTNQRNEKTMRTITGMMQPIIMEFNPQQLALAVKLFSILKYPDLAFVGKLVQRASDIVDDMLPMDVAMMVQALGYNGAAFNIMSRVLKMAEAKLKDLHQDDVEQILHGLLCAGPRYVTFLTPFVMEGLEQVENLNGEVLTAFLAAIVALHYKNVPHAEIFVDAIIERVDDLGEKKLITAMESIQELKLLSEPIFEILAERLKLFVRRIDSRNIPRVMDVCSRVPFKCDEIMTALLSRTMEELRTATHNQMAEILEIIETYPPAKDHPIVVAAGKHVKRRMDLMGPDPLCKSVKALAALGHADTELYLQAATNHQRWGYKDFTQLEAILLGLCNAPGTTEPRSVRILASHLSPMAVSMSLSQVERANRYMNVLQCDDDEVYRALADRVRVFIRDVNAELPQDLQVLLQRGAPVDPNTQDHQQPLF